MNDPARFIIYVATASFVDSNKWPTDKTRKKSWFYLLSHLSSLKRDLNGG
ncbi:hypothetical protein phiOC_p246 [Ochrobactrum phage vB_OspM_OC]|nr:hypothetical protein phiOC_p246 [Ochrobactrum phage vB_OspM_OC]